MPDEMIGAIYYEPSGNGYEAKIKEWLEKRRSKKINKESQV